MNERRHSDELIHEIHGDVKALDVKVTNLERYVITGNGGKGLGQRVGSLERWRSWIAGGLAVIGGILGMAVWLFRELIGGDH